MAKFYKGFVFEQDVNGRLTVEGNLVPPGGELEDHETLAHRHIDRSVELMKREAERANHLDILRRGTEDWNQWRRQHPEIHPMLICHDFSEHDAGIALDGYDFSYTNFTEATLKGISLRGVTGTRP